MDIILRIKEFYLLEMLQVSMYQSQVDSLQNEYFRHVYERMIALEKQHVEFYKEFLKENNQEAPVISGGLTSLVGGFLGETLDFTTAENRFKLGIALENKAIEMYRAFIMEAWEYPELCQKLWHNMIDEEFHLLWFKDNLKHLTSS